MKLTISAFQKREKQQVINPLPPYLNASYALNWVLINQDIGLSPVRCQAIN